MFDNFYVNHRKNEGFLPYIPCILIPEYGQSNAPLMVTAPQRVRPLQVRPTHFEFDPSRCDHGPFVCLLSILTEYHLQYGCDIVTLVTAR